MLFSHQLFVRWWKKILWHALFRRIISTADQPMISVPCDYPKMEWLPWNGVIILNWSDYPEMEQEFREDVSEAVAGRVKADEGVEETLVGQFGAERVEAEERKVPEGDQPAHIDGRWNRREEDSRRRPAGPRWWSLKQKRGKFYKTTSRPTLMVAETGEEGSRRRPTGPHWWSLKQKRGRFQKATNRPTLMVAETGEEGSIRRPAGPHWWSLKQTRVRLQKASNWPTLMVAETEERKVPEGDQLAHIDGRRNRRE